MRYLGEGEYVWKVQDILGDITNKNRCLGVRCSKLRFYGKIMKNLREIGGIVGTSWDMNGTVMDFDGFLILIGRT